MQRLWQKIFFIFLVLIVFFEGIGYGLGRLISYYLILAMPVCLFFLDLIERKKIYIPRLVTIPYSFFLFFSMLSTFYSSDLENSIFFLLFYIAVFLLFIAVYNHQEDISKGVFWFLVGFGLLFSLYSLFLNVAVADIPQLLPWWGYQLVYPKFGSHNHLGDFLSLVLVATVIMAFMKKKILYALLSIFFFPFFILSFSRSAYMAFFWGLVLGILFLRKKVRHSFGFLAKTIVVLVLFITGFLIFATVKDATFFPGASQANKFLSNTTDLGDKYFRAKRTEFMDQALLSFDAKPWLGVGPGNFIIASREYATGENAVTETSHNIFFDILSENGVLAFSAFAVFIFVIFYKGFRSLVQFPVPQSIVFFLSLALFINFQTDYTYRMFSVFSLFFIFLGTFYAEEKKRVSVVPLMIAFLLAVYSRIILFNIAGS